MSALPLILAAAGTGAQVAGTISAADSRAKAAEADAASKFAQANELLSRADVAESDIRRQGQKFIAGQRVAFGQSGFAASSGPLLHSLEETQAAVDRQVIAMRRDAAFKADQLRKGASVSTDLAGDYRTTGWLSGAGAVVGNGYRFGDASGWWTPKADAESLKSSTPNSIWTPFRPFGEDPYYGSLLD